MIGRVYSQLLRIIKAGKYTMSKRFNDVAIFIGVLLLGALIVKALFDPHTQGYKCPKCSLVLRKGMHSCPRCHTQLDWSEAN